MALGDKIRKLGSDAVNAGYPVAVMFGTVTNTSPLEVYVDQRFTLDGDFLVVTELLSKQGLNTGDPVLLLRVQGGQRYVVWDRVVGT